MSIETRTFSEYATKNIKNKLKKLLNENTTQEYRQIFYSLGEDFSKTIIGNYKDESFYLVSTNEDADFLTSGILKGLENYGKKISLACYWNQRMKVENAEDIKLSTARIVRSYEESDYNKNILIIVKSIISSGCVIKYNIERIFNKIKPGQILIVAPVMSVETAKKINHEFPEEIRNKFKYLAFAIDSKRDSEGYVIPGIGGSVYENLGIGTAETKNKYIPKIIKERRKINSINL